MSHIRVESHQKVVTDAKVFFVNGDEETDISHCVQVVDLHLGVGELATATLRVILGKANVTAQIEDVLVSHTKPRRRRGLRDITTFSDLWRRRS